MSLDYKQAGVNKEAGYKQVEMIKSIVKETYHSNVLTDLGGFAGLYELGDGYTNPVLISGTDGVGTKLKIAQALDKHTTVGIDLVAMCVNDIICQGAKPLFFLDYIATDKLIPEKMAAIVSGVAEGCKQGDLSLIGGETAEMPGMYAQDEYDLAGFACGVAEKDEIITGEQIKAGDIAIGLSSSGVHSNGFSLVRAILEENHISYTDKLPYSEKTVGEELLTPTRIYVDLVRKLKEQLKLKGLAHITGGGVFENLPRILPAGLGLEINTQNIPCPKIFSYLQELGDITTEEMYSTFNMGVGMIIVIAPEDKELAQEILTSAGEEFIYLGEITAEVQGVKLA